MRDNIEEREVQIIDGGKIEIKKTDTRIMDSSSLKREISRSEEMLKMYREEAELLKENYEKEKQYKAELIKALEDIEKPSADELEINLD